MKSGKLQPVAFQGSVKNSFGISVSRWSNSRKRAFTALALASAKRRGPTIGFKGFAILSNQALKQVRIPDTPALMANAEPTRPNPFHANIPLLRDREKSYYLLVATEIIEKVAPVVIPNLDSK